MCVQRGWLSSGPVAIAAPLAARVGSAPARAGPVVVPGGLVGAPVGPVPAPVAARVVSMVTGVTPLSRPSACAPAAPFSRAAPGGTGAALAPAKPARVPVRPALENVRGPGQCSCTPRRAGHGA